jgi:hypothetical protein
MDRPESDLQDSRLMKSIGLCSAGVNGWWIAAFAALLLVPIWGFSQFPTPDGPPHNYDAKIIREYPDQTNSVIRSVYKPDLVRKTDWTSEILLSLLQRVVHPIVAEKLIQSLCVLALPFALLILYRATGRGTAIWPSAFILGYSHAMMMGFFNYLLALSATIILYAFWWSRRMQLRIIDYAALFIALCAIFVTHVSGILVFGFAVMTSMLVEICLERKLAAHRKRFCLMVILLIPFGLLTLNFMAGENIRETVYWPISENLSYFIFLVISYLDFTTLPYYLLLIPICPMAILSIHLFRKYKNLTGEGMKLQIVFLSVSAVFLTLYFVSPWGYRASYKHFGYFLNERFFLPFIVFLAVGSAVPASKRFQKCLALALGSIAVLHTVTVAVHVQRDQKPIREIMNLAGQIPTHKTFSTTMPDDNKIQKIQRQVFNLAQFNPDVVFLGTFPDFPPSDWPHHFWRLDPVPAPDYVLWWQSPKDPKMAEALQNYQPIVTSGDVVLMEKKTVS